MNKHKANELTITQTLSIALGAIIGFGCFILPSEVFLPKGGTLGSIIGIIIGAIFVSFIAYGLKILIKYFPSCSGSFEYSYYILNKRFSFICGWILLVSYIAIICINVSALTIISRFFAPGIFESIPIYTINGWTVHLDEIILNTIVLIIFTICNIVGLNTSAKLQTLLAFLIVFGTVTLFSASFNAPQASIENIYPLFPVNKSIFLSILSIIVVSPYLFIGFDTITLTTRNILFNINKIFFIMILSIIVGALIYILVLLSTSIPSSYLPMIDNIKINNSWLIIDTAKISLGKLAIYCIVLTVLGAVLSGINGFLIASSKLLYSMSSVNQAPKIFTKTHKKSQSPYVSLLLISFIVFISEFLGRDIIKYAIEVSTLGTTIGYIFICICAIKVSKMTYEKLIIKLSLILTILFTLLLIIPGTGCNISLPSLVFILIWFLYGLFIYKKLY